MNILVNVIESQMLMLVNANVNILVNVNRCECKCISIWLSRNVNECFKRMSTGLILISMSKTLTMTFIDIHIDVKTLTVNENMFLCSYLWNRAKCFSRYINFVKHTAFIAIDFIYNSHNHTIIDYHFHFIQLYFLNHFLRHLFFMYITVKAKTIYNNCNRKKCFSKYLNKHTFFSHKDNYTINYNHIHFIHCQYW